MEIASWTSYPKIYNVGHPAVRDLFSCDMRVEEKVDGSQLSFGVIDGVLRIKSRNREFDINAPDNMFRIAAETILNLESRLRPGYTYRGEYLQKTKHNSLEYDRVPANNIVIFDIARGYHDYLSRTDMEAEAEVVGFETVPLLYTGVINEPKQVHEFLYLQSFLGGAQIEGLVFKPTSVQWGRDGKPLYAKYVSERFREIHSKEWSKKHEGQASMVDRLVGKYGTEQRWHKAVQHLRDSGELEGSPRDIGKIVRAVQDDIGVECRELIMEDLWKHFGSKVLRGTSRGVAEWYKEQLLVGQFV